MIDLKELQEESSIDVLYQMGNNILKQCVIVEYETNDNMYMEADANNVSVFRRAIDFVTRCITKFIAWIRKCRLKSVKEKLIKIKKDPSKSNFYQDENNRTTMTYFYPIDFFNKNILKPMNDFNNCEIFDLIASGNVRDNYDRKKIEAQAKNLASHEKKLKSVDHLMTAMHTPVLPLNVSQKDVIDQVIQYIDFCINDVYESLNKAYASIKVIKDYEMGKDHDDSKAVSQQYTRAMTLFGQCLLREMTIVQKTANTLTRGATFRKISFRNKLKVEDELTQDFLFDTINEAFSTYPEARTGGVYLNIVDVDNEHHRLEVFWFDSNGNAYRGSVYAKSIAKATKDYVSRHKASGRPIMPGTLKR